MAQWPWKKPRPGVDSYGRSPLWHFAASGDMAGLERGLRGDADPTAADKDGFGALHVAAQNGHAEIVRCLLKAGADVNAVDQHGNGALWTAAHQATLARATEANFSIVRLLLDAGADPHHRNAAGRSPADIAARSERLAAVFDA